MVRARGLIVLTAATLVAFACGGTSGTSGSKGTIKIGSDLPTCTVGGKATQNGADFAVKQKKTIEGFDVTFQGFDDCRQGAYNADAGVDNVRKMIDQGFLGMVGPYNSAVAKAEIPIGAPKNFVMISPANTNPCLTKDIPSCATAYHPQDLRAGNPNNYWRVVTTDDYQGPAMADYAYNQLGIKNVAILDDSTVFGTGIAGAFETEFKKLGGTVVKHQSFKKDQQGTDFKSLLQSMKTAQGLYVGGTDDQNICIPRKQMKDIGWNVPFMGGDGIETTDCINQAAGNENNIYATSAGADATQVESSKQAIADFRKQFTGANDFGGYTMQAYDAANILMTAIGNAIKANNGNMPNRKQVRDEMAKITSFQGVIGNYGFDQNGDTTLKIVSIYIVQNASDPNATTGVCGQTAKNECFVWKTQFDFAKAS